MTTEEPEGYGALGVLSKEEAELEKVYDTIIKVGTLDGIRILSEQLKQERNKAIDDFKQRLKSRIITWNASTQEDVPSYSYRDIFKLIDNL